MWLFPDTSRPRSVFAPLSMPLLLLLLGACDGESAGTQAPATVSPDMVSQPAAVEDSRTGDINQQLATAPEQPDPGRLAPAEPQAPVENTLNPGFTVGTNQYVFDISNHSREELIALLKRADEVATVASAESDELDVALILHGPDIGWFAKKNYEENKELVDLAARLDALRVIDLKICEKSMQHFGYREDDIPEFIDRVPYAPDEMRRLEGTGYFRL